jgi:hypothetical protein
VTIVVAATHQQAAHYAQTVAVPIGKWAFAACPWMLDGRDPSLTVIAYGPIHTSRNAMRTVEAAVKRGHPVHYIRDVA